jgi:putative hydrolase of the HAD superfamily
MREGVPWETIRAVFLDVGNTVVGIDLERVVECLEALGVRTAPAELERAEARARPELSRRLAAGEERRRDGFLLYLELILARLPTPPRDVQGGAARLAPLLREPGRADQLWSRALPGARAALERLRAMSLPVIAVSNSDGSATRSLERAGMLDAFDAVVDSHLVGVAKPDPAIFELARRHVRVPRERVVHVGDMLDVDVVGARAAGLRAVLLDPFGDWVGAPCDCLRDVGAVAERLAEERR